MAIPGNVLVLSFSFGCVFGDVIAYSFPLAKYIIVYSYNFGREQRR